MSRTKKSPLFDGQENQANIKRSHLQKAVTKLQKNVKTLVLERELWSREKGRGFSLLRPDTQNGHWEFVQNETAIVFNSGLKTAANEIVVWEEGKKLSYHDISDLKLTDSSLRRLKGSLEKLPMRHRIKGKSKAKKNKAPAIPLMFLAQRNPFHKLEEKLVDEVEILGITLEEAGNSASGSPFMIISFKNKGTMIWIKEVGSPYWYDSRGEAASSEEIHQMESMLNELERTTKKLFVA